MPTKRNDSPQIDLTPNHEVALIDPLRLELARRYAKAKDILNWGRILFPSKFPLDFCGPLHGYFVDTRHVELTSTEAPRFHSKTTIKCFLIPIFQALEEPETFNCYLNVQATDKKALAINTAIRAELESNKLLLAMYGEQHDPRKWTDQVFVTKFDVVFMAASATQSIRGIQFENRRPDYTLVDDLYDEDDIHNPDSTEKKTEWVWSTLYPTMAVGRRTCFHIIGTAINATDILEKNKKKKAVLCRSFDAMVDENRKIALWPEGKSFEKLIAMRELMGSIIFNREMRNLRHDDKESKVHREWLANWEYEPTWLAAEIQAGRLLVSEVVVGNDPSIGKDKESDDTGTCVTIKTVRADAPDRTDYWIHDLRAEKLTLEGRKDQLVDVAKAQPPELGVSKVKIEAIGAFDDYASYVVNQTSLPVERVAWVKDKLSNLENKSHHFENRRVHINKNIGATSDGRDLKEMAINQLTTNFPKNDDVRDGILLTLDDTSGLWNWI